MLTQRLYHNPDETADLVIRADREGVVELVGLAEELKLRISVRTEAPIHRLNDPQGNGTPNLPPIPG